MYQLFLNFRCCDVHFGNTVFEAFVFGASSVEEDDSATGKDTELSEHDEKRSPDETKTKKQGESDDQKSGSKKKKDKGMPESDVKTTLKNESDVPKKEEDIPTSVSGESSVEYSSAAQPRVYVRSGVHYFNVPPPDSPQPTNYNPTSVPVPMQGYLPNPYYYQAAVQYIPPIPTYPANNNPTGMIPVEQHGFQQPQCFINNPNQQPYFVPSPNQVPVLQIPHDINIHGSAGQNNRNNFSTQNLNQNQSKPDEEKKTENQSQSTKKKQDCKSKSDSSESEGIFPIFVPTKNGLVPRYVSSTGMNLIDKISEEYCKSPDSSTGMSTDPEQSQSSDNSSRRRRRPFYIEKNTSSESDQSNRRKGTPWPFIHINKNKAKGKETSKKSIYVIPTKVIEPPKSIKERSEAQEKLKKSETYLGQKGSQISFQSIDNDNKSRPTSTEGIDTISEDATSRQLGSLSISEEKSDSVSVSNVGTEEPEATSKPTQQEEPSDDTGIKAKDG